MGCGGSSKKEMKKEMPETSGGAESIVVWSYRKLADYENQIAGYDAAAKDYGDYMKERVPGVYCYTYAPHPGKGQGIVCDVQWFNTIEDFRGHMFMTELTGMKKMLAFTSKTDPKYNYRGYVFGAWEQTWYMGMSIPTMFGNMPPTSPAWFEFRQHTAGFIRKGPAGFNKPPIMIMSEWLVKKGEVDMIVKLWSETCDSLKDDQRVMAHWLSKECLSYDLKDKDKHRNPEFLVGLSAFEDEQTFLKAFDLFRTKKETFKAKMEAPLTAEIWAEYDENIQERMRTHMEGFDWDGKYTFFKMDGRGWSDHSKVSKKDEKTLPDKDKAEHKKLCEECFGGFPDAQP